MSRVQTHHCQLKIYLFTPITQPFQAKAQSWTPFHVAHRPTLGVSSTMLTW